MMHVRTMERQDKSIMIDALVARIVKEYNPRQVILFGSHAYGEPDSDSDIDLLILKETDDRFIDRWTKVQKILIGASTSVAVDTVVMTPSEVQDRLARGDQWVAEILQRGKVLYDRFERIVVS